MNGFIDKTGKFIDTAASGITHERFAFVHHNATLDDMLKAGYVRIADFGEHLAFETENQLTDDQLDVLDAALKERDRFTISYRIGQDENQVQEFRPIRPAKLRVILGVS